MENSYWIIIIIVGSGLLGGITNFFLLFDTDSKNKERWSKFFASITLSLCASFTVPLFLQILSNNILDTLSFKNALIFTGFCIIASFFSKRFLEDLYQKVKNLENKVEKQDEETKKGLQESAKNTEAINKKVEDLEESFEESELDSIPSEVKTAILSNNQFSFQEIELENLINSIFSAKYSNRTVNGIAKETGITQEKIQQVLEHLKDYGFAESRIGSNNRDFWRILKNPIKIYSANYGIAGNFADVTSKIKELISKGIFEITASQSFLGIQDPVPGIAKILKIHCRIHGRERELQYNEGDKFQID